MARRFEANYRVKDGLTRLGEAFFNSVFRDLDLRLHGQEEIEKTWQSAIRELNRNGLRRIDEFLAPAYENISNLAALGFLSATLDGDAPVTFALGEQTVLISEGPERDLFHPSPYVTISVESDPDKFAVARTISYDRDIGAYRIDIISRSAALASDLGPHAGIHIAVAAGSLMATLMFVDEAGAIRGQTEAIRGQTETIRQQTDAIRQETRTIKNAAVSETGVIAGLADAARIAAEKARDDARAAEILIQGGPVSSVNSHVGAVTLTADDVGAVSAEEFGKLAFGLAGKIMFLTGN